MPGKAGFSNLTFSFKIKIFMPGCALLMRMLKTYPESVFAYCVNQINEL